MKNNRNTIHLYFDLYGILGTSTGSNSIQNRLHQKSSFSIPRYRGKNQQSILYRSQYWIIENPILKVFSLCAKFHLTISPKIAPKPYIETLVSKISKHWYWQSSDRNCHIKILNLQSKSNLTNSISNQHYLQCMCGCGFQPWLYIALFS